MGKTDGVRRRGKRSFQIRYYDANGIRQEETVTARNATEAAGIRNARLADIAKGIPVSAKPNRIRFEELCADVVNYYIANKLRSMSDIEARYRLHIIPAFGNRRAASITTADLTAYLVRRESEIPKPSMGTLNRELEAIRRAFKLALQGKKILSMPHVPVRKENNVRSGFFTRDEVERLCSHLPEPLASFVRLAFLTGWRKEELRGLRWSNVDFEAGELRLDPGTTKSGDGRVFPMSDEIRTLLGNVPKKGLYVFPIGEFRKTWKTACFKAGLPCILNTKGKPLRAIRIFHDLRRSAVRELVRSQGLSEREAMTLTGHKTRSVFDRYSVVSTTDLKTILAKLNRDKSGDKSGSGRS